MIMYLKIVWLIVLVLAIPAGLTYLICWAMEKNK